MKYLKSYNERLRIKKPRDISKLSKELKELGLDFVKINPEYYKINFKNYNISINYVRNSELRIEVYKNNKKISQDYSKDFTTWFESNLKKLI